MKLLRSWGDGWIDVSAEILVEAIKVKQAKLIELHRPPTAAVVISGHAPQSRCPSLGLGAPIGHFRSCCASILPLRRQVRL